MKTKDLRDVQEKNYCKLWWIQQVNAPFRYALNLIRKKWSSLNAETFEEAVKRSRQLTPFQQLEEAKKLLKPQFFSDDVVNLAREFNFEDFWTPYLVAYIMTGKVLAPPDKPSKNIPSQHILRMRKVFLWRVKEFTQQRKLREKGYKGKRRKEDSKGKYMDDVSRSLNETFIHDDSNIADIILGKSVEILSEIEDKKRKNIVKQDMKRLEKELVKLTPQYKRRLGKIFK